MEYCGVGLAAALRAFPLVHGHSHLYCTFVMRRPNGGIFELPGAWEKEENA